MRIEDEDHESPPPLRHPTLMVELGREAMRHGDVDLARRSFLAAAELPSPPSLALMLRAIERGPDGLPDYVRVLLRQGRAGEAAQIRGAHQLG